MLLPYYIASLNIEHAYYELNGGKYEPFEGLCFVDTLDLAEHAGGQLGMFSEENTERVERQKDAPITVIIGNPPYNVGQLNENDNNKNRKYEVIDERVRDTYARDSTASNKNAAVRRLRQVLPLGHRPAERPRRHRLLRVSNNSFVDQIAFDGMRKHLLQDFTRIYHLDLHGNVRQNPKLSGTTHNVFGIQVGVGHHDCHQQPASTATTDCFTTACRRTGARNRSWRCWRKAPPRRSTLIPWQELTPDAKHTWRVPENADEYASLPAAGQ